MAYRVGLFGASGRMGRAIIQILSTHPTAELSLAVVEEGSVFLGMDSGLHAGTKESKVPFTTDGGDVSGKADVLIDFSIHSAFMRHLSLAKASKIPLVVGTTGINESDKRSLEEASRVIPIVFSPNMSVGVNLLFRLTQIAAKVLATDFDIEVLDIHHRHKKDSPSGTAQRIKEVLVETLNRKEEDVVYGRHGMYPEREKKEIAVHTMRGGEVIGDHTVYFLGPEERIEISHKAQDRKTFAVGAVRAGEFLRDKTKGLYDMFDVLGL